MDTRQELRREAGGGQPRAPKSGGGGLVKLFLLQKIFALLGILAVLAALGWGVRSVVSSDSKTTRLGFEDLGELATQAAYCTEVNVTEAYRELFGLTIPFTQSKYIYSYDVEVRAGLDFQDVRWSVEEDAIRVTLPEIRILGAELELDSFRVYHEEESIFRPITLDETNAAMEALKDSAVEDAIANGLLESARSNAEAILTGFFAQAYDLTAYSLEFSGP